MTVESFHKNKRKQTRQNSSATSSAALDLHQTVLDDHKLVPVVLGHERHDLLAQHHRIVDSFENGQLDVKGDVVN